MGERSKLTTLCYIEKDDSYLMLHRVSKKNDENKDKWIGIGGHFEEGESPEDCLLREAKEETGLTLTSWKFRGIGNLCFRCVGNRIHVPVYSRRIYRGDDLLQRRRSGMDQKRRSVKTESVGGR